MKGVIFNVGSENVKYAFFVDKKIVEKKVVKQKISKNLVLKILKEVEKEVLDVVCHRVVHGYGNTSQFLNEKLFKEIKKASDLARLHNPYQIKAIEIIKKERPNLKQFIAFDTDAFLNLPKINKIYALPKIIVEKFKIYRYGFHGLSVEYVIEKMKEYGLKNFIVFHLGGGCSITAVKNLRPIDTSMGFTPLEGCVMMNRPGSIDPGIVLFLCKNLGIEKTEKILYNSGMKSLANTTNFKKISKLKTRKDRFAFEFFCNSLAKVAYSYLKYFDKLDAIVFTGGIGENNYKVREKVCKELNIRIDNLKNKKNEKILRNKKPYVMVIETNEEEVILRKLEKAIKR
jgi:acetate kinase